MLDISNLFESWCRLPVPHHKRTVPKSDPDPIEVHLSGVNGMIERTTAY